MVRYTQDTWKADQHTSGATIRSRPSAPIWNQPGKSLVAQLNQNIGSKMVNAPHLLLLREHDRRARAAAPTPSWSTQLAAAIPTLFPSDIKQQGGEGQPMANWGSLGAYGGGVLGTRRPG